MDNRNFVKDALLGVAIGDALGVPAEFVSRGIRVDNPVTGMKAHGSHDQLAGTWSDDTSLTLCLAEMLCRPYSLKTLAGYFINWKEMGYYTARGHVFDIGIATSGAIHDLGRGVEPVLAGGADEYSNGNGSLMRILPLLFFIKDKPIEQRFSYTREVSSLTHRHIRSVVACFIYLEYARLLLQGHDKLAAYYLVQKDTLNYLRDNFVCSEEELDKFHRVLGLQVGNYDWAPLHLQGIDDINSAGYVIDTLEASIWCILQTDNFKDAVLQAVNLGQDTDTTAAVTGGLAGILYGADTIPAEWLEVLARREDIIDLAERMNKNLNL